MIAWSEVARVLAALTERPAETRAVIERRAAGHPPFRNLDYEVTPSALLVHADDLGALIPSLEEYVQLLGKVVRLFRDDEETRRFFGIGATGERFVESTTMLDDDLPVCRLDGYLEWGRESVKLLENNADSPAGTMFTCRVNALNDLVVGDLMGAGAPVLSEPRFDGDDALLEQLLECHRRRIGTTETPTLAILQIDGRPNRESVEMATTFTALGVPTFVADPRTLEMVNGKATLAGRPTDLCWNKINTVYWIPLMADEPEVVQRWITALRSGAILHVNPFGMRYVAESKAALAYLQDERFADRFTARERAVVADLLPWARKLSPGRKVEWEGERVVLEELVRDRQHRFVMKQPYDIRGDGVTIGAVTATNEWARLVDQAVAGGYSVQEAIPPTPFPVVDLAAPTPVVPMASSFDTFVFGGRVCGFGAKASQNPKVNVFQGGRKLPVRILAPAHARTRVT